MTKKELRTDISKLVKKVMFTQSFGYKDIIINDKYQTLSISDTFFVQGEDAQELINEANITAKNIGLNIKTCLVWILESSGLYVK